MARWKRKKDEGLGSRWAPGDVLAETGTAIAVAWKGRKDMTMGGVAFPVIVRVRSGAVTKSRLARELRELADELDPSPRPRGVV